MHHQRQLDGCRAGTHLCAWGRSHPEGRAGTQRRTQPQPAVLLPVTATALHSPGVSVSSGVHLEEKDQDSVNGVDTSIFLEGMETHFRVSPWPNWAF